MDDTDNGSERQHTVTDSAVRKKGEPRYAYGARKGRMIHVSDESVGRGKEAFVECPGCGKDFHKFNHKTTPHLRHAVFDQDGVKYPPASCEATWRSGIHEVLVGLIAEHYRDVGWHAFTDRQDTLYDEDKNPEFYADIVLQSPTAPYELVFIEVRVTHGLPEAKAAWLLDVFDMRNASVWTFDAGGSEATNYLRAAVFNSELDIKDLAVLSNYLDAVVRVPTRRYEKLVRARVVRAEMLAERERERRRATQAAYYQAQEVAAAERRIQEDGWRSSTFYDGCYRYFGKYTANIKRVGSEYQVYFSGGSAKFNCRRLSDAKHTAFLAGEALNGR